MKKTRIFLGLLLVISLIAFSGCTGGEDVDVDTPGGDEPSATENMDDMADDMKEGVDDMVDTVEENVDTMESEIDRMDQDMKDDM